MPLIIAGLEISFFVRLPSEDIHLGILLLFPYKRAFISNDVLCSSELCIRILTIVVLLIDGFGSSSSELCGDIFGETNTEFMADFGS